MSKENVKPYDEVKDRLSRRLDDSMEAYLKTKEGGVLKFSYYQDFKSYCSKVNEVLAECQRTYYLEDKELFKKAVTHLLTLLPIESQDEVTAKYNESEKLESDPRRHNK